MSIDLITIKELLADPDFKKFFLAIPKLPDHYTPANLPWKLIVLKPGETVWRSKRFGTYGEAFAGFKKMLPSIENAAINCPPLTFMPPVKRYRVKGKLDKKKKLLIITKLWVPPIPGEMEQHLWCPHCRRPSIFRNATTTVKPKGNFSAMAGEPAVRCIICGASDRIIDLRHPENHQKWDSNRPIVSTN